MEIVQRVQVAEVCPACEDQLIPGAGHSVATTHSPQVGEILADFIDRHH